MVPAEQLSSWCVVLVRCWFGWGWCVNLRPESKSMNPAAALGDEALGKRGEGCRASPLLGRGRTVQTLAKVYEDRAAECSRAAQQTDDPVFRRLLLMLASQWKFLAREEAKSKDAPTSLASTQPQPLDESCALIDEINAGLSAKEPFISVSSATELLLFLEFAASLLKKSGAPRSRE